MLRADRSSDPFADLVVAKRFLSISHRQRLSIMPPRPGNKRSSNAAILRNESGKRRWPQTKRPRRSQRENSHRETGRRPTSRTDSSRSHGGSSQAALEARQPREDGRSLSLRPIHDCTTRMGNGCLNCLRRQKGSLSVSLPLCTHGRVVELSLWCSRFVV